VRSRFRGHPTSPKPLLRDDRRRDGEEREADDDDG